MRVRTDNAVVEIVDGICGVIRQRLKHDVGDFVLRRADGVFTYQLAVVVDDAEQGVTHVVRGSDLLASTPRQIHLQHLLGYPTPAYMHLPLVVNVHGEKLGKQTHAPPLDPSDPVPWLIEALHFLGQQPPAGLAESGLTAIWEWATRNWKPGSIPSRCPHASHARHA
jgi:glutamyl-Q tRNA(Asp) synthetase